MVRLYSMEVEPFCAPYLPNLSENRVFPSFAEDEAKRPNRMQYQGGGCSKFTDANARRLV